MGTYFFMPILLPLNKKITLEFSTLAKKKPFRVGVKFDETETCTIAAGNTCEWDTIPGGIIGFKLIYWQVAC